MKTLILTEENYTVLMLALDATPAGRDLMEDFGRVPELPSDRELVAMARNGDDPPEAIARARDYRDAGRQAAIDTREAMEELLRHCYHAGVRPVVLGRWFGLKPTRVYEIIG